MKQTRRQFVKRAAFLTGILGVGVPIPKATTIPVIPQARVASAIEGGVSAWGMGSNNVKLWEKKLNQAIFLENIYNPLFMDVDK